MRFMFKKGPTQQELQDKFEADVEQAHELLNAVPEPLPAWGEGNLSDFLVRRACVWADRAAKYRSDWQSKIQSRDEMQEKYGVVSRDLKDISEREPEFAVSECEEVYRSTLNLADEAKRIENAMKRLDPSDVPHWMLDDLLEIYRDSERNEQWNKHWLR